MPFREKCPVCRLGWRVRPDVKTCSRQCSKEWSNWTPAQRVKATNMIASDAPLTIDSDVMRAIDQAKATIDQADDPYPDPLTEEDPAASHIFKILGG